jgi:hypothetical protein
MIDKNIKKKKERKQIIPKGLQGIRITRMGAMSHGGEECSVAVGGAPWRCFSGKFELVFLIEGHKFEEAVSVINFYFSCLRGNLQPS